MRFVPTMTSLLAAGLAACSGGSGGLTTGSLFGSGQASQATVAPPAPVPFTPTDRALHMGAVAARASKCGYNFDPAKLKSAYLAYEAQQGTAADQLQRIEREYEFSRLTVRNRIAKDEDYCSDAKTRQIKADLTRHLAGDFSPPPRKVVPREPGWFESLTDNSNTREVINHEYLRDKTAPKTKRVEVE